MSWLTRLGSVLGLKSTPEGAYHPGPYFIHGKGWLPHDEGQYLNFWQMDYDPVAGGSSAMVEACVSAYAQTIAMCPFAHWLERPIEDGGGREKVITSALHRITRAPNDYQTRSDFILNLVRSLYLRGNAYALGLRNDRFEIDSLHLMHPDQSRGQAFGGEVFYELGGNPVIENRLRALGLDTNLRAVPARDVLHVKLQTPTDPLKGETPLAAAALAVAASNASLAQSLTFYKNQSRPSGVIETDHVMSIPQNKEFRKLWDEQSKGLGSGGTPILTNGLKFKPIMASAKDTQAAESLKLSDGQIAQVFRVPLAIVGSEAQPMGSTEALMNLWISTGLGFALNQVELAFDRLFELDTTNTEYSELDSSVLLRSAFRDRIEGLVRGVQGGVFAPNEARAIESMPAKKGGDEPRVQQQLVPLSFAIEPPVPPAPPPAANDDDPDDELDEGGDDEPTGDDGDKMTVSDWNRYFEGAA